LANSQPPKTFFPGTGLGTPRGYYPIKAWNRWASLLFSMAMLGLSALVLLVGMYDTYVAFQQHGPAMIDDVLVAPFWITMGLFVLGLLAGWSAVTRWNKGVAVFEEGFAVRNWKGIQLWRWQDVVSMTSAVTSHSILGIHTGTTHHYDFTNSRKQRLFLTDSISKVEQLAQNIDQRTYPLLYEIAAAHFNAGQSIPFGRIRISRSGIVVGRRTYPWMDVKAVSIQHGILKVSGKEAGWFSGTRLAISGIPNARVLLTILEHLVGLNAGQFS
jgi:hypothetical protein